MATINPYLTFDGDCEAAFNFYRSVFGTEFGELNRFGDMPQQPEGPELTEEERNRIMHMTLPISADNMIYGSDTGGPWADQFRVGNNISLSLNANSREEAAHLFEGLSAGGKVTMPLADTFWGAYFGMWTDKFGINWLVNYDDPNFNQEK